MSILDGEQEWAVLAEHAAAIRRQAAISDTHGRTLEEIAEEIKTRTLRAGTPIKAMPSARDLPVGSIVAVQDVVWIKRVSRDDGDYWSCAMAYDTGWTKNPEIQGYLDRGAEILRIGVGQSSLTWKTL